MLALKQLSTAMSDSMNKLDARRLEQAATVLRSVAHPVRISILELLDDRKSCNVTEIYETLGMEQAIVSNHLAVMRKKGLLATERSGKNIFYSLNYERLSDVISCMETLN